MRYFSKKLISSILIVLMVVVLCACSSTAKTILTQNREATEDTYSIWVVTEATTADGMNYQAEYLANTFQTDNPNISIHIDIIPTSPSERSIFLHNLRDLIQSGKGPDVYLLPTSNVLTLDSPQKYNYIEIEPLFKDVQSAMKSEYFFDITDLYENDNKLPKSDLNTTVMDAGIFNGIRYIIPLRFNLPVLYVNNDLLNGSKVDISKLNSGIDEWMQHIIDLQDSILACGAEYVSLNAFSQIIDYESDQLVLDKDDLMNYLCLLQKVRALVGNEIHHRSRQSIESYLCGYTHLYPAQIGTLDNALDYLAIAQSENISLTMYPLRCTDGKYVATISYYAAIGASCRNPSAAYDYIRMFLSEEAQWERIRLKPEADQYSGLLERSWPVLISGSVDALWRNRKLQINKDYVQAQEISSKKELILSLDYNDSILSILQLELDHARFPTMLSTHLDVLIAELNDYSNNSTPNDVNIESLAENIISSIQ